ncbi:GH92 family glycosyl hydrolase [Mangrovibacterium diazotrophicum]|uniref:Putative alpha-1,2-mannosidase n=1 Tax=Mangrovibacterium diazotrophicum TaxID=1261403 RepID=A0A419W497_9BACT|nr:GH92 family glycosyl hydrolase [Mangrovibacterium diazotrophicum]RKD90266.1 putative alpha-1,2-mannosidase [Mangrovibacterium diazotrophicum]
MQNTLKNLFLAACSAAVLASCGSQPQKESQEQISLTQYVDPYIGTGFHGHVFLGADVPFGAVQLGPSNITQGWDWCSGYHYSDSTLIGFAHTHLSGTGIGDLGDIVFMPVTGDYKMALGTPEKPEDGYLALYKHEDETVKPGYYAVDIDRYKVKAELTTTERVGYHRYAFQPNADAHIIVNLERGIGWDAPVEGHLEQINDTLVVGYRLSKGWAVDQRIYFAAVFSQPLKGLKLYSDYKEQAEGTAEKLTADLDFGTLTDGQILAKVAISPVSTDNAIENMKAEAQSWDFDQVVAEADTKWNNELAKVTAKSADPEVLTKFYTALYHTMIAPSVFQDVNGDYRGADGKTHNDKSFTNYTTFSLWDTYRANHPLSTIIHPDRVNDFVNTMLHIYEQQGELPVWHLMGNETYCMVGYPAIPVIVDAYRKGFTGFDANLAWEAVKNTAMGDGRGLDLLKKYGYMPANSDVETVAKGLEYAVADGSIALMAEDMGKSDDAEYFKKRGENYKNYFDTSVGHMRGRVSDTEWRTPFDPFRATHRADDFCEGNSWQYTWLVPQDVPGLVELMGGKEKFLEKLDEFFVAEGDMGEHASNDITGLIGQYAHGNEPSHHITYLYALEGQPEKTAKLVRKIMSEFYTTKPDGLIGNEDVGQMSAWYVLSAMGFYQVNPADGKYVFGSPDLDEAVINLPEGKTFTIKAENNSKDNIYIKSKTLNGQAYDKPYITYEDIMAGGELVLEMAAEN